MTGSDPKPEKLGNYSDETGEPTRLVGFFRSRRTVIYLLILGHLALTAPLAYRLSLGLDETFTLNTTSRGIRYAIHQAIYFELQAPLYFGLLSVFRTVSMSLFWGRLFSVICIALTLKVAASLSERLFPRVHPGWVVLVLAIHPYLVWAATEMRVYALSILLATLLLLVFHEAFMTERPRGVMQVGYLFLAAAALYTHYYLGFLLVANAGVLLTLRRWRQLGIYILCMGAAGACFAPLLILIPGQLNSHTQTVTSAVSVPHSVAIVAWNVKEFILPADATPLEYIRTWIFRVACVALLVLLVRRFRQRLTPSNLFVAGIFVGTVLCYIAVVRVTGSTMSQSRHFFVLFSPAMLLAFALTADRGGRVRVVALTLILMFCATSLVYRFMPMTKYGNWDQVTSYLMERERPGEPILIFHAGAAQTFGYYYRGPNAVVPLPRDNRFDAFDIRDFVLTDEAQIDSTIERKAGRPDRAWLVTDGVCGFMDVDYHCRLLDDYIAKTYIIEDTVDFATTKVRRLRRK